MNREKPSEMIISTRAPQDDPTFHSKSPLPEVSAVDKSTDVPLEDGIHESTASGAPKRDIFLTMATLCAGGILTSLDAVIVATSLPSMAKDLNATAVQYSWVGSSYLLASASFAPLWTPLSDAFGRKPTLALNFMFFSIGCLISALADDMATLIAGRALQGCAGGGLLVLSNICIVDMFALRDRSLYLAAYGASHAIGASLGPIVGGALSGTIGWRWCFWINLPVSVPSVVAVFLFFHVQEPVIAVGKGLRDVDWVGAILVLLGTVCILVGLQSGGVTHPWTSGPVIALIVVGSGTLCAFVLQQSRPSSSILPSRVLANRSVYACLIIGSSHGAVYIGCLFYFPVYLQYCLGNTPTMSGVWMLTTVVPLSIFTIASALIMQATGTYRTIIWTSEVALATAVGLFVSFTSRASMARLIVFQLILSLGIGPLFQAPLVAIQACARPGDAALASSMFLSVQTFASAISIVVGQVFLQGALRRKASRLRDIGIPEEMSDALSKDFAYADSLKISWTSEQLSVFQGVLAASISQTWIVYAAIAAVGLIASLLLRHKPLR